MKHKNLVFSIIFTVLFLLLPFIGLPAEEKPLPRISAEELLQMDLDKVFPIIEKLNKEETAALITQIRSTAKTSYKDIDKFYLLISQLESIKAIAIEEKRLKDLHLVYGLGLFLFSSVLGYVIFSQRKIIQSLQQYLDK